MNLPDNGVILLDECDTETPESLLMKLHIGGLLMYKIWTHKGRVELLLSNLNGLFKAWSSTNKQIDTLIEINRLFD